MKPLKIVMSAFGPYPDRVEVNLAPLGARGLFLITGPTGAGKTTIFDALAFALYGEASGSTRTVDSLRSDFADPQTKTYVELTFTHRQKTYIVTRNPRYARPKKSGEGLTTENADATLKLPGGQVIAGYREVNSQIVDLLGINYGQFKQIAMIAQGEFLQLLLADSKDRGEIFRRVFGTNLFQAAQNLLKERERQAKRRLEDRERAILQDISKISAADEEGELAQKIQDASIHAAEGILEELETLIRGDLATRKTLQDESKSLEHQIARQIEVITNGRHLSRAFEDLDKAQENLRLLSAQEGEHRKRKKTLEDGEKALYHVRPWERDFQRELKEVLDLEARVLSPNQATKVQSKELETAEAAYKAERQREPQRDKLSLDIGGLEKLLPQYDQVEVLDQNLQHQKAAWNTLAASLEALKEEKRDLTVEKATFTKELESLIDLELRVLGCEQEGELLRAKQRDLLNLRQILARLDELEAEYDRAQESFTKMEAAFTAIHGEFLTQESAFFQEQAGLLALSLKEDQPCPVCGSLVHPKKASLDPSAPSELELNQLKERVARAREKRQEASEFAKTKGIEGREIKRQLSTSVHLLLPGLAPDPEKGQIAKLIEAAMEDNEQKQSDNTLRLRQLGTDLKRREELQNGLATIEQKLEACETQGIKKEEERADLTSAIAEQSGRVETLRASLEYGGRRQAQEVLETWQDELDALRDAFQKAEKEYHTLRNKLERNQALLADQEARLAQAIGDKDATEASYVETRVALGFPDEDAYRGALRTDDELKELKEFISSYEQEMQRAHLELERLAAATENKERPVLVLLQKAKDDLEAKKQLVDQAIQELNTRLGINVPIAEAVEKGLGKIASDQREFLLISNLAKTACGELPGKQKLAFELYVQAFYFNQILGEANKRLRIMTNHRFELQRREDPVDLRSQTGLEIDVLDHYTGRVRSVKSLSGGESFKASLSLALGLSDVIQSVAGGVEIDTLFVDEGFGALDQESLEQAIQTLVGLAEGNRLIGIISHVSELKERIDRQIRIEKTVAGSTIKVV